MSVSWHIYTFHVPNQGWYIVIPLFAAKSENIFPTESLVHDKGSTTNRPFNSPPETSQQKHTRFHHTDTVGVITK
jgi:hypothetical protein